MYGGATVASRCGQAAVRRSSNAMGHLRSRQDAPMTPFFQVRQLAVLEQVRSSNAFWFLVQPPTLQFFAQSNCPIIIIHTAMPSAYPRPPPHGHRLARSGTGVGPASTVGSVVLPSSFSRHRLLQGTHCDTILRFVPGVPSWDGAQP